MADPTHPLAEAAFALRHLLALLLLAACAWGVGRWVAWDLAWRGPAERAAIGTALGLAVLAHLGFLLGLSGHLARGPLAAVLLVAVALAWPAWRELADDLARLARPPAPGALRPSGLRWRRIALVLAGGGLALAPLLPLGLHPPAALDATLYHLPVARAFARTGELPWPPGPRDPVLPQLSEVLFAGMMLLAGDRAAHLVELVACLATAALLLAWGSAAFSPAAGWVAAAAWLGNPLVVQLGATADVEPGLALFGTASLYSLWRRRGGAGRGWLALAAAFAAAAAAVQVRGLFFLAVGAVAVVAGPRREGGEPGRRRRRGLAGRPRDLAVYAGVALAVLLPWYGLILFSTGTPAFPSLPGILGASPGQPDSFPGLPGREPGAAAGQSSSWSRFGQGLVPVLPLLSLALGAALDRLLAALPLPSGAARRRLLAAAALVLFLPGWLYAVYRVARQGPPRQQLIRPSS